MSILIIVILISNFKIIAEEKEIVIAVTTDLHGWLSTSLLWPGRKSSGLLHIKPLILNKKNKYKSLILIDSGDLLYGSPLSYFQHYISPLSPEKNLFFKEIKKLNYDAIVPGNHDFELNPVLEDYYFKTSLNWVADNLLKNGKQLIPPYKIIYREGIKILVFGLITPGTPLWVSPKLLEGLDLSFNINLLAYRLKLIKFREKPDLMIGVFHAGINSLYDNTEGKLKGVNSVNPVTEILNQFSGFDLAISGHSHWLIPRYTGGTPVYIKQTPVISAGSWGRNLLTAKLKLDKINSKWKLKKINIQVEKADQSDLISDEYKKNIPDQYLNYINQETDYQLIKYDRKELAHCLNKLQALVVDNNKITGSMLPLIKIKTIKLKKGNKIRRKDLWRWIPYNNKTATLLFSLRDLELLRSKKEKKYNRKFFFQFKNPEKLIPFKKSPWKLNAKNFERKFPIKISDYHFHGGGGIISELFMQKEDLLETSDQIIREELFNLMTETDLKFPAPCPSVIKRAERF